MHMHRVVKQELSTSWDERPQQTWSNNWGRGYAPFLGNSVPISHNVACAEAYLRNKWHLDPYSRLATTDIAENWGVGGCAPFRRGELGPHLTQYRLGRDLHSYQAVAWCIQPFGHVSHGPKIRGGLCPPFWRGEAGSPSNTMSPAPRPTSVPSGILIYPAAVWPQYMERGQTDNGPIG